MGFSLTLTNNEITKLKEKLTVSAVLAKSPIEIVRLSESITVSSRKVPYDIVRLKESITKTGVFSKSATEIVRLAEKFSITIPKSVSVTESLRIRSFLPIPPQVIGERSSVTYRIKPKQQSAATLSEGDEFTGYGAVNSGLDQSLPGNTDVKNGTYPSYVGSYRDRPGLTIKEAHRTGVFIDVVTLANFGLGIDEDNDITHDQDVPKKYSSSEQSSP